MDASTENRLRWIEDARQGLIRALGDDIIDPTIRVFPTADPIRLTLKITLLRPLPKASRAPLRLYLRAWAMEANCELPVIKIERQWVQAELLTKARHWHSYDKPGERGLKERMESAESGKRGDWRAGSRARRSGNGVPRGPAGRRRHSL